MSATRPPAYEPVALEYVLKLLSDLELSARQVREVHHHQQILHTNQRSNTCIVESDGR